MMPMTLIKRIEKFALDGASLPAEGTLALLADWHRLLAERDAYRDALLDIQRVEVQHVVNLWNVTDQTRAVMDHALGD